MELRQIRPLDITAFLEGHAIDYRTRGKSTSKGWVNVTCPFCGLYGKRHMGIHIASKIFHCWNCNRKGLFHYLFAKMENIPISESVREIGRYIDLGYIGEYEEEAPIDRTGIVVTLPFGSDSLKEAHKFYLSGRGFDPLFLVRKYGIKGTGQVGKFPWSIIIPVFIDGRLVSFASRDITGRRSSKYIQLGDSEAALPGGEILYNLDNIRGSIAVILEGYSDVWRFGDSSVGVTGDELTPSQATLLKERGVSKAFVMYDAEPQAQENAERDASILDYIGLDAEILELEEGDPGELEYTEITRIRREIGL